MSECQEHLMKYSNNLFFFLCEVVEALKVSLKRDSLTRVAIMKNIKIFFIIFSSTVNRVKQQVSNIDQN